MRLKQAPTRITCFKNVKKLPYLSKGKRSIHQKKPIDTYYFGIVIFRNFLLPT